MRRKPEDVDSMPSAGETVVPAPTGPLARGREVPGRRALRTALRTAHLLGVGALYGGCVFGVAPDRLASALWATTITGLAFVFLEVYAAPVWIVQVRGMATVVKVLLFVASALLPRARVVLLTCCVVIGSVSSHMPGRFRYYSVLHGRQVGGKELG